MNKPVNRSDLIYPELSYSITGSAMDVHNGLGPGWDEWDYHRAMIHSLTAKGHDVVSHNRMDLLHRNKVVDNFELDLLVDDKVIRELKHIKMGFHPEHYTQIINYLKHLEKRLGILMNYGLERLNDQRILYNCIQGTIFSMLGSGASWRGECRCYAKKFQRLFRGFCNFMELAMV
ncbi:MAG: GxxExxY protein [Pontiella sp.]